MLSDSGTAPGSATRTPPAPRLAPEPVPLRAVRRVPTHRWAGRYSAALHVLGPTAAPVARLLPRIGIEADGRRRPSLVELLWLFHAAPALTRSPR